MDVAAKVDPGVAINDYTSIFERQRIYNDYDAYLHGLRHRWVTFGDTAMVWRLPEFLANDDAGIDQIMRIAKGHWNLIIDLRDNPGGSVATLLRLIGWLYARDMPVAVVQGRRKTDTLVAHPSAKEPFQNRVIVLVNSGSASASEIFSRINQLQHRAVIVGDRSMGAVMVALFYTHEVGFARVYTYGAELTIEDMIMPDGGRLENVGVIPDTIVLPTAADLAAKRDPVLAAALGIAGVTITPERAATLFTEDRP
jgi:C-terminal processing protease CtpA/Prc